MQHDYITAIQVGYYSNTIITTKHNKYLNRAGIEEYLSALHRKCVADLEYPQKSVSHSLITTTENKKVSCDNKTLLDKIPCVDEYKTIMNNKYSVSQLKTFMKHYKLKCSGAKKDLIGRLHTHLRLSFEIVKIQKCFRCFLYKRYIHYHGPAFIKRMLCNNPYDFLTGDSMKDIPYNQFISFKDIDGFVYGFDIVSLYNLLIRTVGAKNPYNRNEMPLGVKQTLKSYIRLSDILGIGFSLVVKDDEVEMSDEKMTELKIIEVFQNINLLGNYSDASWFLSLNRSGLITFIRELMDIWNYRAQIDISIKRNICPPYGNLIDNINIHTIYIELNVKVIQQRILPILSALVNSGVDNDFRALGSYYILSALTLVSQEAANALPWLYQSVVHN